MLAKRKTAIMKEIEGETGEKDRIKKVRIERAKEKSKQLLIPDNSTLDYEKQLRKLATRGGYYLFFVPLL